MMRGFKLHPYTWKWWREVNIHKNISYGPEPEHRLDIYQPELMPSKSPGTSRLAPSTAACGAKDELQAREVTAVFGPGPVVLSI